MISKCVLPIDLLVWIFKKLEVKEDVYVSQFNELSLWVALNTKDRYMHLAKLLDEACLRCNKMWPNVELRNNTDSLTGMKPVQQISRSALTSTGANLIISGQIFK